MDIIYSNHAKKRMIERDIEGWEIEHAVKFPSYIKKDSDGKIRAHCILRNREIEIVYIREDNYIKVITVI